MNYETLVRELAQAQSPADTLREPPGAVDVARSGIGDHAHALHQVVEAIAGLLGADGGALSVVDDDGVVQWATATSQPACLLTQVEQDFEEGPGVDARATGQPVAIPDLRLGPRWLGSVRSRPATACGPPWPPPSRQTAGSWVRSRSSWQRHGNGHKPTHKRSAATPTSSGGCW